MMQLVMTVCQGGAPGPEGIAQWVRWPCGQRFEHIRRWLAGPEYESWMDAYGRTPERGDRRVPGRRLAETKPQNTIPVWTS